jgi:aminopeptidase N
MTNEISQAVGPDPHSCANPAEVRVTHLELDLTVDFENRKLKGSVTLQLSRAEGSTTLWLDSRLLTIHSITSEKDEELAYTLAETGQAWKGESLRIVLLSDTQVVKIEYETHPESPALQWLSPSQTDDHQHPFLFSQSQAILARSWIPLQDGPGYRFTYSAKIKVPKGMRALMSAPNKSGLSSTGEYSFRMPYPIPAYLLSIAVGVLDFRPLGPNTGVYAEPGVLSVAAYEFAALQSMLETAAKLYGPYRWDRYDLLVLPPSFPFGGMENPCITFVTPTILSGDRSLVSLVAHELAHSWSGNLVTNATWNDFWLNEGFTVYFERRIMEAIEGAEYAKMLAVLGWQDLQQTLKEFKGKPDATCLKLKLSDQDPDEGMNEIAYEKGYLLLCKIESVVGRAAMDKFLVQYFEKNAFKAIDTEGFLVQLKELLLTDDKLWKAVSPEAWIYKPGLPKSEKGPVSARFEAVQQVLDIQLTKGELPTPAITRGWSTHEWLHYLRGLPKPSPIEVLTKLDAMFHFSSSGNAEISCAWFLLGISSKYYPMMESLQSFLFRTGRRKFIVPLYKSLLNAGFEDEAQSWYAESRPNYHYVAQATLDPLVGLPE